MDTSPRGKALFLLLGLASLSVAPSANAVYNTNMVGVVNWLATYTDSDAIYFTLSNQPSSHPGCSAAYFVIPAATPQNRRNQAFATLTLARQTGEPINIGYDATGDCADGYIHVHRVG